MKSDVRKWSALSVLERCRKPMERKDPWNDWNQASASQLQTYDECPRKWFIEKILGLRTPDTDATNVGTRVHEAIEAFIKYGQPLRDPIALPAKKWLWPIFLRKKRRPDEIEVEKNFRLMYKGVTITGKIDIAVFCDDTIIDHKTTSSWKWAKNKVQLRENIQVNIYVWAFFMTNPGKEKCTVVFNYLKKKNGKAQRLVEVSIDRRSNANYMEEKIKPLLQGMKKDATKALTIDVRPDYTACGNFGGCPFRDFCHARKSTDERHESRADYAQARRKKNDDSTKQDCSKSQIRWRELEKGSGGRAGAGSNPSTKARGFGIN